MLYSPVLSSAQNNKKSLKHCKTNKEKTSGLSQPNVLFIREEHLILKSLKINGFFQRWEKYANTFMFFFTVTRLK
ncbi:MAG: hypothetical protein EA393_06755 [Bacteroidetes bacterium]|nr:MAG: hypothetical protein EA393_06755 [Bacteroidota bacterium]